MPPLARAWRRALPGTVSYAVIADGRMFVTFNANGDSGSYLLALDPATGKTLWGPVDLGSWRRIQHPPGSTEADLAYDGGRVFVAAPTGHIEAFSAASGALEWTTLRQSVSYAGTMVTPADGLLLTNGVQTFAQGGQPVGNMLVRALSESTGKLVWQHEDPYWDSGATVGDGRVYYAAAAGNAEAFNPATGKLLWTARSNGDFGASFDIATYADGRLWARMWTGSEILDAATGKQVGTFTSDISPVVDSGIVFYRTGSTLEATSEASGAVLWQFSGDGKLEGSPLVVGATVYIGSYSGTLYALRETTGQVEATEKLGAPVDDPATVRRTMTAGDGLLAVPAGRRLVVFHGAHSVLPPPRRPVPPPAYAPVPGHAPDQATSFLENAFHNGDDPASPLKPPLHRIWVRQLPSPVSYPLIVGGGVFVTALDSGTYYLYGFSAATGRRLWPRVPLITAGGLPVLAAYDQGRVFEVSPANRAMAVDARTGRVIWQHKYPAAIDGTEVSDFTYPVTIGGTLYFGATLYPVTYGAVLAVSERTGAVRWLASTFNGEGTPTFTGSALVDSSVCNQVAISAATGRLLWKRYAGCGGGGFATTVAYHTRSGTRIWALDEGIPNAMLDPASGKLLGSYSTTATPTFAGNFAYYVTGGAVRAETISSNWVEWSFSPPSPVQSAPVRAGRAVYAESADGTVYALDAITGRVLWHGIAGAPVITNEYFAGVIPGMAAGDGRLVVAASNRLAAFG